MEKILVEPYAVLISDSYFIFIVLEITLFLNFHFLFFTFVWLLYKIVHIPQPTNIFTHFSSVTLTLMLLCVFHAPFLFMFPPPLFFPWTYFALPYAFCLGPLSVAFGCLLNFSVAYSRVWHFSRTWDRIFSYFPLYITTDSHLVWWLLTLNNRLYKQIVTSVLRVLRSLFLLLLLHLLLPLTD
jgi:hypothetical protein